MLSVAFWHYYVLRNALSPYLSELDRFHQLSPAVARQQTATRLLRQIQHFGRREDSLPEWREAAAIKDPAELWKIWPSLPVVTKRHLAEHFPAKEMGERFGLRGKINSSGGSTGEPTFFFQDSTMVSALVAASIHGRRKLGWRYGMPVIGLWGSDRDIGKGGPPQKERLRQRLANDWLIASFEVNDGTVDRCLEILQSHHPAAIYGYSSILEFVARKVIQRGAELAPGKVHCAWNGGEMLFEQQSELFCRAFGVPIHNWYGGRELGTIAVQNIPDASLEVLRPHLFIEIVDEAGKPAPPGESGRLLLTHTLNQGTPFLRFEVGDMGASDAADQDESGVRRLTRLDGRNNGLLRLPGGKMVNSIFWSHLLKEFDEVHQFQVVIHGDENLELRFRGEGFVPEREEKLRTLLLRVVPDRPVNVQWVKEIPLTRQGKLVHVVRV